jgi:hypothetical protein
MLGAKSFVYMCVCVCVYKYKIHSVMLKMPDFI